MMSVALINKGRIMDKIISNLVNYFRMRQQIIQICHHNSKEIEIIMEISNITTCSLEMARYPEREKTANTTLLTLLIMSLVFLQLA